LTFSKDQPKKNLELAFNAIQDEFDIPPLLEVDDMLKEKPDDKVLFRLINLPIIQTVKDGLISLL
jgi:hypothetical protein